MAPVRFATRFGGLSAALVGVVASGLLVNVLLVVVARSVSVSDYATFSAFWSVALIAGFGVFLPVEQWLAQRIPAAAERAVEVRAVARLSVVMVAAELAVVVPIAGLLLDSLGGGVGLWLALAMLCAVSGLQFVVRGLLIGSGRLGLFSAVLVVDVGVRVAVALALSLNGVTAVAPYAWSVVIGIGAAHLPLLVWLRRDVRATGTRGATPVRAVTQLLVGSLCAQIILNGPAVGLPLLVDAAHLTEVGAFQAAFQLVRVPLFLAVPVQAVLVPLIVASRHDMAGPRRSQLTRRFLAATGALIAAGFAVGWFVGPLLVRLVFGAKYDAVRGTVAILGAGTGIYLSMLVLTQVLVAERRHGAVGGSWGLGVAAGVVVLLSVPNAVLAAALSFTIGGAVALAWALRSVVSVAPQG